MIQCSFCKKDFELKKAKPEDNAVSCPYCGETVMFQGKETFKVEPEEKDINEVPNLALVDFSEYEPVFENTHSHLPAFDLINKELGLEGKEYYVVVKAWNYRIESLKQPTIKCSIGKEWCDNRIHVLCIGGAGTGKGILKNALRLHSDSVECSGARTNLEQLIGKFDKKGNELPGYFKKKNLDVDEAHTLVTEEDKNLGGIMREFRIAMDVYGNNMVDKKNVDAKRFLSFYPETRFGFYIHDTILPPVFFDLGTSRRLFAFELKPTQVGEDSAIKGLLTENYTHTLKEYVNLEGNGGILKGFTQEAVKELIFWIKVWNKFCLLNPNQRVRILGRRMFFSGKLYFMRMSMILGIVRNEQEISAATVKQACFDCIHFLLNTIQVYSNKSVLTLSRDIWKTSDQKEAMFLEWLNYQGALSRETSGVSIADCQDMIGDIFGVNNRQAISVYSRLRKAGYVIDYKGQHDSKAWLGFNPNLEEFVDFGDRVDVNLKDVLLRAKWELEQPEVLEVQATYKVLHYIDAQPTPPTTTSSLEIITSKVGCNSNNSDSVSLQNNSNGSVGSSIHFLEKKDYELLDGDLGVGRCTGCGKSGEIVAINRLKRLALCEFCFEGL